MAKQNFLLGKGEQLATDVVVKRSIGDKEHPYTVEEARQRLTPMLRKVATIIDQLPPDATPKDHVVISLTINPEYIAKSYYPTELLRQTGIEVVGSRPRKITPEKRSKNRPVQEAITTELYAEGSRSAIREWSQNINQWHGTKAEEDLVTIEEISAPTPSAKIKGTLPASGNLAFEIVFHSDESSSFYILDAFKHFLKGRNLDAIIGKRFFARGLSFVEVDALAEHAVEIAEFSMVRALRRMPGLRMLRPPVRSAGAPTRRPIFPTEAALSREIKVAIFDGGIPHGHPITAWATPYEFPGMAPADEEHFGHGVAVTSAALFGHIDPDIPLPRPYAHVDHYRVLDPKQNGDCHHLYDVLQRIEDVLSQKEYDFVNLSLGPCLPIEDDDVHAWTAVLDDRFARSATLATIAVGNDGEGDAILGLNRVQVPSDCVNALAIGAVDTPEKAWRRAPYSSVGPGRSPGLIKPDLVEFGGVLQRLFLVLTQDNTPTLDGIGGTSFAAPSVIRAATGIRAHFATDLNHLAIRTLLVHTAEASNIDKAEVGWGRVARTISDMVFCDDDTVRVVYQGEISPAKYIRVQIPLPTGQIKGKVSIKATLCYKSQTDPHHPGNYTRAGLEVTFRPHDGKFKNDKQLHADSKSFFGVAQKGATEEELRRDAWKWENCLHSEKSMLGSSLNNPIFDIHYNARMEGHNHDPHAKLKYALVVTVTAKNVVDLYNQVVRKYANRIEPIRPVVDIPVRV